MIPALVCVISLAALLQFFISYSRAIIAAYRKAEISDAVRELVSADTVSSSEFAPLLQFVRLCPQRGDDQNEIRVVRAYYRFMGLLRSAANSIAPSISRWAEHERENCAYFAAVALDRRIAASREFIAQQMPSR